MKRTILLLSLCCQVVFAQEPVVVTPVIVTVEEDFVIDEVIDRLDEHMTNVETWYQTSKRCAHHKMRKQQFDMALLRSVVQVTHTDMVHCFTMMEEQQSLDPFFMLWKQFKTSHAQQKDDQLLCKEIAFLTMHLYSTMLGQLQRSVTRVTVTQMLELYRLIAALPIFELLNLLDSIATEIIGLLDQTYHGEDSFFSWFWHNWWVPPMIISHSVSSLVEGIVTIMITGKDDSTTNAKEEDKKSALARAF